MGFGSVHCGPIVRFPRRVHEGGLFCKTGAFVSLLFRVIFQPFSGEGRFFRLPSRSVCAARMVCGRVLDRRWLFGV